jgi:hypothetical protein
MSEQPDKFVRPVMNLDGPPKEEEDRSTNHLLTSREELLAEAAKIIAGNRDKQYGGPEDSFSVIADLWSVYLNRMESKTLGAPDVAAMMVLFKVARLMTGGPKQRDTWLDTAGYAACGWEVSERS